MISYLRAVLLLPILAFQAAALIDIDSRCSATERTAIEVALGESKEVAQAAVNGLTTGKLSGSEEAFKGAYNPLFGADAKPFLLTTLKRVIELHTDPLFLVTVYCEKGTREIMHDVPSSDDLFEDRGFINKGKGDGGREVWLTVRIPEYTAAEAFSTLGFVVEPGKFDFSSQGHIHLRKKALEFPAGKYDSRPLKVIKENGLQPQHTDIDSIFSTSTIFLHELIHIAGGLAPNSYRPQIMDGPNKKIYTWKTCVAVASSFAEFGIKTQECADCVMLFAVACYLQIQKEGNKPTCWNTGNVNPDTLESAPPSSTWVKRGMEVMEARARWHARSFPTAPLLSE